VLTSVLCTIRVQGLFAEAPFVKDEMITEYVGELIRYAAVPPNPPRGPGLYPRPSSALRLLPIRTLPALCTVNAWAMPQIRSARRSTRACCTLHTHILHVTYHTFASLPHAPALNYRATSRPVTARAQRRTSCLTYRATAGAADVIGLCGGGRVQLTDLRESKYESMGIGCYMFTLDDEFVIDATIRGI
jgi:hypothetical protein